VIASARTLPTREERFLEMLPQIREQARHAFRNEQPERREDLLAEVIANCWVAFVRLMDRGLDDVIYPTPLVQYAIKQVRDGRRVGNKLNSKDVSSGYAQRRKSFVLKTLDLFDDAKQEWKEVLVEDKHAGPADTAASRLDFADWLRLLPRRLRRIAETLAKGETTKTTAKRFRVSPGRISQLRRELQQNWQDFQGGPAFA
jgi:hypothetical protein